jgi:hypothetical protein
VARTCTVCASPERQAIDRALVARQAYRVIAGRFSLARSSLARHQAEHLPALLARAYEAERAAEAGDLLAQLRERQAKAEHLVAVAEDLTGRSAKLGDLRTAIAGVQAATSASREVRECLELLAEVEGRLSRQPSVNLTLAPQWLEIRGVLMDELRPYPELRASVAARLRVLEGGAS